MVLHRFAHQRKALNFGPGVLRQNKSGTCLSADWWGDILPGIEVAHLAEFIGNRSEIVVPDAEIQSESRRNFPVILEKAHVVGGTKMTIGTARANRHTIDVAE